MISSMYPCCNPIPAIYPKAIRLPFSSLQPAQKLQRLNRTGKSSWRPSHPTDSLKIGTSCGSIGKLMTISYFNIVSPFNRYGSSFSSTYRIFISLQSASSLLDEARKKWHLHQKQSCKDYQRQLLPLPRKQNPQEVKILNFSEICGILTQKDKESGYYVRNIHNQ